DVVRRRPSAVHLEDVCRSRGAGIGGAGMTEVSPDVLQQFRPLALCRGWDDIRDALRARCDELRVARSTVDLVGGLPDGQCAKLLAPVRRQEMGRFSFPAMLGALGLVVLVAEDADALA